MPESTFVLTYDQIRQRVGHERGYRTEIAEWTEDEREKIEFCTRDGSDDFYNKSNHEWSFLTPLVEFTLEEGESELELPWDFGFVVDPAIYFDDNLGRTCRIVGDDQVLLKRQNQAGSSGRPVLAAVVVESKPGNITGQRSKLIYWPEASEDYTVQIRYSILGAALSAATPMPYGGAGHAGTILEACLAASERMDGNPMGSHSQTYQKLLEASKVLDRRNKPRVFRGQERYPKHRGRGWRESNIVTYIPGP